MYHNLVRGCVDVPEACVILRRENEDDDTVHPSTGGFRDGIRLKAHSLASDPLQLLLAKVLLAASIQLAEQITHGASQLDDAKAVLCGVKYLDDQRKHRYIRRRRVHTRDELLELFDLHGVGDYDAPAIAEMLNVEVDSAMGGRRILYIAAAATVGCAGGSSRRRVAYRRAAAALRFRAASLASAWCSFISLVAGTCIHFTTSS